jgi:hypothetical protein
MIVSPLTTLYEKVLSKVGVGKDFVYHIHDIINIKQCFPLSPTLFILVGEVVYLEVRVE